MWFYTNKAKSQDFIALFVGIFILIAAVYVKLHIFQNFGIHFKALSNECFYLFLYRHAQKGIFT